ncbi:MAG: hypothetical protein IPP78_14610 [Holophagaceae bacterium]|nr:hypothetical protein [Holophagaceae bacterium]
MSLENRPIADKLIRSHWYKDAGIITPEKERIAFTKELSDRFKLAGKQKSNLRMIIYLSLDSFEANWVYCEIPFASRNELLQKEKAVRRAGEALINLPSPYNEYFGGIGKHLVLEADVIHEGLPPMKTKGRPKDKLKLDIVGSVYTRMAWNGLGAVPPDPPESFQIEIAQAVYEFVTNDNTSLKNWQILVRNRFMEEHGERVKEQAAKLAGGEKPFRNPRWEKEIKELEASLE